MAGRNDPCPCGSGKKYKKCCLAKDQAARSQAIAEIQMPELSKTDTPLDYFEPESILKYAASSDFPPTPEADPLLKQINAFWEQFMDAPYEKQWSLVTEMLAEEPELCDGEMVFEIANTMFGQAVAAGETERYQQLLDQLEKVAPEAYAEEIQYVLDWRIQIALVEGDETSVKRYFYQFSTMAGDQLDLYYRIISALAYHGKMAVLHEGMRQARPYVADGSSLAEWAYAEFTEKLGDIETTFQLEQNPDLQADDATLQQRLAEYELTIDPELLPLILDYRTGRKIPSWTPDNFKFSGRKKKDPAKKALALLLAAFTHFAHVEADIPRTKVEMARDELSGYISQRHAGELDEYDEYEADYDRRPKRKRRKKSYHALCPDAQTLDRYLALRVGFMSFRHYEAFALFELLPAWLRFLTKYELLDEETRRQTVNELSYIKDHLRLFATNSITDPALQNNLADWPYEPQPDV